jgi:hypothetical protein
MADRKSGQHPLICWSLKENTSWSQLYIRVDIDIKGNVGECLKAVIKKSGNIGA